MKKAAFLAGSFLVFSVFSCNQDIDLTADWQNIPVVYGLLNAADTAHYIRVEKAFQDQNGNAFLAAMEPDSIYYTDATVRLLNLTTGKQANLVRVDGSLEGYPRDPGEFAQFPNYLYKVKHSDFPMEGGDEIRFILERGDNLPEVTAECEVLDEINCLSHDIGSSVEFPDDGDETFRWSAGEEARIFDLSMVIRYDEKLAAEPDIQSYQIEWPIAHGLSRPVGSATITAKVFGLEFYKFMAANIEARPDATRLLTGLDLIISGGGEAVEQYISIALANTGITSAQEIPVYSNLSEGRGILTSVVRTAVADLVLNDESEEFLKTSTVTGDLNFQ